MSWPIRPASTRKVRRVTACRRVANSAIPTTVNSTRGVAGLADRRDALVDALLDQVGDGEPGGVLDEHDRDQQPEPPAVRAQQVAEQPAGAGLQQPGHLVGDLLPVGGDAAPRGLLGGLGPGWSRPSVVTVLSGVLMPTPPGARRRSRRRRPAARGRPGRSASRSLCRPTCVIVPSWSSATLSASSTVDARCATTMPVASASTRRSASSTSFSVCTSSADRVSSSTRTLGRASTARASASRCRWPPDRDMPCSPIRVSSPHGRSCTNPAWATSTASRISSSVASATTEREVLPGAHREQGRLLEGGGDDRAQVGQLEVAHVDPVDA